MRGKVARRGAGSRRAGIIPACAGKRLPSPRQDGTRSDHPRVCGEKNEAKRIIMVSVGSSPRVRGKVAPRHGHRGAFGIIPACAGKSHCPFLSALTGRDHPRVCGEKRDERPITLQVMGSSPRVRGKAAPQDARKWKRGIIPACAGKSCNLSVTLLKTWDHPRVCGEKSDTLAAGHLN